MPRRRPCFYGHKTSEPCYCTNYKDPEGKSGKCARCGHGEEAHDEDDEDEDEVPNPRPDSADDEFIHIPKHLDRATLGRFLTHKAIELDPSLEKPLGKVARPVASGSNIKKDSRSTHKGDTQASAAEEGVKSGKGKMKAVKEKERVVERGPSSDEGESGKAVALRSRHKSLAKIDKGEKAWRSSVIKTSKDLRNGSKKAQVMQMLDFIFSLRTLQTTEDQANIAYTSTMLDAYEQAAAQLGLRRSLQLRKDATWKEVHDAVVRLFPEFKFAACPQGAFLPELRRYVWSPLEAAGKGRSKRLTLRPLTQTVNAAELHKMFRPKGGKNDDIATVILGPYHGDLAKVLEDGRPHTHVFHRLHHNFESDSPPPHPFVDQGCQSESEQSDSASIPPTRRGSPIQKKVSTLSLSDDSDDEVEASNSKAKGKGKGKAMEREPESEDGVSDDSDESQRSDDDRDGVGNDEESGLERVNVNARSSVAAGAASQVSRAAGRTHARSVEASDNERPTQRRRLASTATGRSTAGQEDSEEVECTGERHVVRATTFTGSHASGSEGYQVAGQVRPRSADITEVERPGQRRRIISAVHDRVQSGSHAVSATHPWQVSNVIGVAAAQLVADPAPAQALPQPRNVKEFSTAVADVAALVPFFETFAFEQPTFALLLPVFHKFLKDNVAQALGVNVPRPGLRSILNFNLGKVTCDKGSGLGPAKVLFTDLMPTITVPERHVRKIGTSMVDFRTLIPSRPRAHLGRADKVAGGTLAAATLAKILWTGCATQISPYLVRALVTGNPNMDLEFIEDFDEDAAYILGEWHSLGHSTLLASKASAAASSHPQHRLVTLLQTVEGFEDRNFGSKRTRERHALLEMELHDMLTLGLGVWESPEIDVFREIFNLTLTPSHVQPGVDLFTMIRQYEGGCDQFIKDVWCSARITSASQVLDMLDFDCRPILRRMPGEDDASYEERNAPYRRQMVKYESALQGFLAGCGIPDGVSDTWVCPPGLSEDAFNDPLCRAKWFCRFATGSDRVVVWQSISVEFVLPDEALGARNGVRSATCTNSVFITLFPEESDWDERLDAYFFTCIMQALDGVSLTLG